MCMCKKILDSIKWGGGGAFIEFLVFKRGRQLFEGVFIWSSKVSLKYNFMWEESIKYVMRYYWRFIFVKMGSSPDIRILFLTLTWKSKSLVAKILKSLIDTMWSQKSIWSFTSADFLGFDLFPVKGETPECLPTLMLKWPNVSP